MDRGQVSPKVMVTLVSEGEEMISRTEFYERLPRIASFEALSDPASYAALPDDWVVGCADIVGSTQLIAQGRYKTVNMLGAAVISAHINASGGRAFPYVFGGDGATLAVDADRAAESARVLGILKRWAEEEFGITMRIAQISVAEVRKAGADVLVARYQVSEHLDYAMFSGGGLSLIDSQMKAGKHALPAAPAGAIPDLEGLSCRWSNARARNGSILSLVVQPAPGHSRREFDRVTRDIIQLAGRLSRSGHPLPPKGPGLRLPTPGFELETHASRGAQSLFRRKLGLLVETFVGWVFFKTGLKTGQFEPRHYKAMVSTNADFRKFDDSLKMTLDCDAPTQQQIRQTLERARTAGILQFGLVEQDEAMITCFVPSIHRDDHIHLVDGASGGYAMAAEQMKSSLV